MSIFDTSEQRRHTKELEMLPANADVHLDGSEWARLANQRIHRERHPSQTNHDLLTSSQAMKCLVDHRAAKTAVQHWCSPIPPTYHAHQSSVDLTKTRTTELMQNTRLGEVLSNVDQDWTAAAPGKTTDAHDGEFWSDGD